MKLLLFLLAAFTFQTYSGPRTEGYESIFLKKYESDRAVFSNFRSNFDYPKYSDRKGWDEYFGDTREFFIKEGEKHLNYKFQYIPPSVYLAFEKAGDRSSFRADYNARTALRDLILAELAEGKGRFMSQIIDGVWYFAEKTSWVHPQHAKRKSSRRSLGDPDEEIIGITSSFTAVIVSYAYHFFSEEWNKVDSSITRNVRRSLYTHVFNPYLDKKLTDSNWWLGMTPGMPIINWCPWINTRSMLAFFLACEDDDMVRRALERSFKSLDNYMNYLPSDGGCDEGPSYWTEASGMVYDFIYLMKKASGGAYDLMGLPRLREMAEYMAHAYIGDGWDTAYADGYPRYSESDLKSSFAYRFGVDVGSELIRRFALLDCVDTPQGDLFNRFESLRYRERMLSEKKAELAKYGDIKAMDRAFTASIPDHWYPLNENWFARRGKWFLSTLAYRNLDGPRNDTHNHNDAGSFILYYDMMPVFIDMGKATPVDGTYDKARYTFWHIRSVSHNVPLINGEEQIQGPSVATSGTTCDTAAGKMSTDIAGTYPASAAVKSWRRSFSFSTKGLRVEDRYSLASRKASDEIVLMTPGEVKKLSSGRFAVTVHDYDRIRTATITVDYPASLTFSVERMELSDPTFIKPWGKVVSRIVLKSAPDAPLNGKYHINIK